MQFEYLKTPTKSPLNNRSFPCAFGSGYRRYFAVLRIADYADASKYSTADIACNCCHSTGVFLMIAGVCFFYVEVSRKNVISTMIKSGSSRCGEYFAVLWLVIVSLLCDSIILYR